MKKVWLFLLIFLLVIEVPLCGAKRYIWISPEKIAQIPAKGPAWENLKKHADAPLLTLPNVSDQEEKVSVMVMAKALVYTKTHNEKYRKEVIDACMLAIGTEKGARSLAIGRKVLGYVIAADLVGLPPEKDKKFRNWLKRIRRMKFSDGRTLAECHEERPNNWGTHAGATRAAIAIYLGDREELKRVAKVFKGWLGDRSSYAGFKYKHVTWWQADPLHPVGINPKGAKKLGYPIGGVIPDDQRRGGPFRWPPPKVNYEYTCLQGAVAQAVILYRAGYRDVWDWEDKALLRAFKWLYNVAHYPAQGDDQWLPHVINYYYHVNFPLKFPARYGKNVGWTDWTHGMRYVLGLTPNR